MVLPREEDKGTDHWMDMLEKEKEPGSGDFVFLDSSFGASVKSVQQF